jgi:NAD(P)-dependent dehydrogenase (short-subunit alcohol dehydrogenase family)
MMTPFSLTVGGFERQFAVNHLAQYLLAKLLLPTLTSSSTPAFNSRVVAVSSSTHRFGSVRFDDINFSKPDSYDPVLSYAQSKVSTIWLANYIDRVYGPKGVHANSVHPGGIWTGLQAHTPAEIMES